MSSTDPWGFSIFADDLRQEMFGKFSIMGVYAYDIVFQSQLPASLPKLSIIVMYFEPPASPPSDLLLKIYFPGDPADTPGLVTHISRQAIQPEPPLELPIEEGQQQLFHTRLPIFVQPFTAKQEGWIKVRIVKDGKEFPFGSLLVRSQAPIQQPI